MSAGNTGGYGEQLAATYYTQLGATVLAQNYRTRLGELDLVVQLGQVLVFVEVKTRSVTAKAAPREFVTTKKQQRIIAAAQQYLQANALGDMLMRFDVVEVFLTPNSKPKLRCITNAFDAV